MILSRSTVKHRILGRPSKDVGLLQVKKTKVWGDDNRSWNLFIVRFYDCELCSGEAMTHDSLSACHRAVLEHYDFAYCRLQRQAHPPCLLWMI